MKVVPRRLYRIRPQQLIRSPIRLVSTTASQMNCYTVGFVFKLYPPKAASVADAAVAAAYANPCSCGGRHSRRCF